MNPEVPDTFSSHREIEELLGAFALDAVDPMEATLMERHLAECPRCRSEVDAHVELAAALGTSVHVEPAEPPPGGLWDKIAEQLIVGESRSISSMAFTKGPEQITSITAGTTARRMRAFRTAGIVGVAAALLVVALLGVSLARVSGQLHNARAALGSGGSRMQIEHALTNPHRRLVHLDSAEGTQLAEFVMVPGGQGYLVSADMPSIPSDETYQLWAMVSGQAISIGLLGNHPHHAEFTVSTSAAPTALAITVEPAGGVTIPDRSPVATGSIAA